MNFIRRPFNHSLTAVLYRIWGGAPWGHYLFAILVTLLLTVYRFYMAPVFEDRVLYILYTLPIAFAAFVGGIGPGFATIALSMVILLQWVVPMAYQLAEKPIPPPEEQMHTLVAFVTIWVIICLVCELMRKAALELQWASIERDVTLLKYRRVLDRNSDAFFSIDNNSRIIHVNHAFADLMGLDQDKLYGMALADLNIAAPVDLSFLTSLPIDTPVTVKEVASLHDGEWFQLRGFRDEGGVSAFLQNITGRKKIEQTRERLLARERKLRSDAEESSRLRDEFVATTSHELRTPLTTILGWAEILQRRNTQDSMKEGLAAIERSTRLQVQLIEDLLDTSRIATGKLKLVLEVVEVGEVLREVLYANRPAATKKGITLHDLETTEDHYVRADESRLAQVFTNIITNAIKFTLGGGVITPSVCSDQGQVLVTVTDTGEGIDCDSLPMIFQRFRQGNSSYSRKFGGLGLGLSIAKELVESHGGKIAAISEGRNLGSTFVVTLPAVSLDHITENMILEPQYPPHLGGIKVLVVDDDESTRTVVEMLLLEAGATVHIAASGEQALELLTSRNPTVVVSDIGMPEMDGYVLIRKIREEMSERGIDPIGAIALTAFASPEDRARALKSGFDDYLAKPVESSRLRFAIYQLAKRKKAE